MTTVLEEIRDRNGTLWNEAERGDYREKDMYRDIHLLAKHLHELERMFRDMDKRIMEFPAVKVGMVAGGE